MPSSCGSIQVSAPAEFRPNLVFVQSCSLNASEIQPGQQGSIDVTVVNNNDQFPAEAEVNVSADGSVIGSGGVSIDAGGQTTATVQFTAPSSEGGYTVSAEVSSAEESGASGQSFATGDVLSQSVGDGGCVDCGGSRSRGRDRRAEPSTY